MFKDKYLFHLIILISFFSDPYIWIMAVTKDNRLINIALILISFLFILKKKMILGSRDYIWLGSWVAVFLFINVHGTVLADVTQVVQSYGYLSKMCFLLVVIYALKKDFPQLLKLFFQYNIVIMYASVVLFFLLLFGIELPSIEFTQGTSGMGLDRNWLYPLGVVMDKNYVGDAIFNRICGLTDEPGQLALLITWMLVLNEFTLKSKSYRNHLIFCGIFTFSFAFLISIALFGIYFLIVKINRPKLIVRNITLMAILMGLIYSLLGDVPKSYINSKIFERIADITSDESSGIVGDNKTGSIVRHYNELKSHDRFWFGFGVTESRELALDNQDFSTYGMISLFTRYLPFYLLLLLHIKNIRVLLLLIIVVNFVQRPGIHFVAQMMCLTFIYYSSILNRYAGMLPNKKTNICNGDLLPEDASNFCGENEIGRS